MQNLKNIILRIKRQNLRSGDSRNSLRNQSSNTRVKQKDGTANQKYQVATAAESLSTVSTE